MSGSCESCGGGQLTKNKHWGTVWCVFCGHVQGTMSKHTDPTERLREHAALSTRERFLRRMSLDMEQARRTRTA